MTVFITGGTGYLGRALIPKLLEQGHAVLALARSGSERKLPFGSTAVLGNALDAASFAAQVDPADTFVHLVGVSHPAPWKAEQFRAVDLASVRASVSAAREARVRHFVYVSVAHPAPAMKAYIEVRAECEALIAAAGLNATVLRPWYILGPGHRWPVILKPIYWLFERAPSTSDTARRLGLVTLEQMTGALVWAVNNPCQGIRVLSVSEIRRHGRMNS